jgi:hypothetical protein
MRRTRERGDPQPMENRLGRSNGGHNGEHVSKSYAVTWTNSGSKWVHGRSVGVEVATRGSPWWGPQLCHPRDRLAPSLLQCLSLGPSRIHQCGAYQLFVTLMTSTCTD